MENLDFCNKHNMVAYLQKSEGSEGFHQIIDFLSISHIKYALTESLTIYVSLIEQFWQTTSASTPENGEMEIIATIDGKVNVVSEASIRRHLKLEDSDGISTLPNAEIFEQLALMGITIPVESHHTPTSAPSTSQPPTSSPSMQTTHAAPMPHDSPIPRVYLLGSDEGSLTLNELTVLLKKLEKTVKTSQARRRAKIVVSNDEEDEEDSSKQGRSLIEDMDLDAGISLVPPHVADQGRFDDTHVSDQPEEQLGVFSAAKVLADAARIRRGVENVHTYTRRRTVSTASGLVSTAGMAQEVEINIPSPVATKDKGKAVMQESEPPKKIKKRVQIQMSIDEELAQKLHEEEQARFNAEQEAKFNEEQEQERLDYEAAVRIQEELDESERQRMAQVHQAARYSEEDLPRKLMELVNQRKTLFAQQRAEAKRNKPMTPAQQKAYMSTYIKNKEGGYSIKKLKSLSFERVKEIFKTTMRMVQSFVPMDSKLEDKRLKRAGQEGLEEPAKRQKIGEASRINVEALQTKYPIIDWKVWKIIRVGNYTEVYQVFEDMLKNFDRDDLVKLWSQVHERFNLTELTDDKQKNCGLN
ncbi:hypothetical protein Tco_0608811 [Tanacetum coccineum]